MGAALLDELRAALRRFVVFPSDAALDATTLWIAATHAMPEWQHATRLIVTSPLKRCGKSRLLDLIEATAHDPLVSANATAAAIFRSLGAESPPTLLIDEADSLFTRRNGQLSERAEDLRGLLNAGFQQGRPMLRCVGPQQTPTPFPTFAMAALAAIGRDSIPDTIADRAVAIGLDRRAPTEQVDAYRHRRDAAPLRELGRRLREWVGANRERLASATPDFDLEDRAADTFEPLVAVADLAGGRWPKRARDAAKDLTKGDGRAEESLGIQILADVRHVFATADKASLASAAIVEQLRAMSESPWGAFELSQRDLAWRLRPYGVKPEQVRPDCGKQVRGYRLASLTPVFARYLAPPESENGPPDPPEGPSPSVTPSQPLPDAASTVTDATSVTDRSVTTAGSVTGDPSNGTNCDAVTDRDGTPAELRGELGVGAVVVSDSADSVTPEADDLGARCSDEDVRDWADDYRAVIVEGVE